MANQKFSLAARVRYKLDAGLLPRALPEKMWAGYGHDNRCDGCGQVIQSAQVEYQFRRHPDSHHVLRLHIGCVGMWVAELRRRGLVEQNGAQHAQ
jgi:hypothetical protein